MIKPCILYGGKIAHTWDFLCETWIVETELPVPPEMNGQILSCLPHGYRYDPETHRLSRFKQEWHFGAVYKCVWCEQRKYEEKWFNAESYERHLAESRRLA